MRALLPDLVDDVDVHAHYAADWTDHGGIRANMIASVDGAASADGKSGGLQTPGDNTVFAALRDLADALMVGWSTVETEGYRPPHPDQAAMERRGAFGLGPSLTMAIVTRSLHVDPAHAVFADADPRTLVITCASSDPARRAELSAVADVLVCGEETIDYGAARRMLAERGLTRVLCEGGPTILGTVLAAGELDELCLSVAPKLTGPGAGRIVSGDEWDGDPKPLVLKGLLEEDGALFARYGRSVPS